MTFFAFTLEQAAKLSSLSQNQIRYWADTGFFVPSLRCEPGRPYGRMYSFRDVVGLRTLALLRSKYRIPLQQLRRVGVWLNEQYDAPWAELRFYLAGSSVYFRDPRIDALRAGESPLQTVMVIELEEVAQATESEANRMQERSPNEHGEIMQHRYVSHNAPVIRGTRVRTEAIWNFHEAGYSAGEIIEQYPRLVAADIAAAIEFESERRQSPAS